MTKIPQIDQVLLFRNIDVSKELGRALWAALTEVDNFFNYDQKRIEFRRFYISDLIPSGLESRRNFNIPGINALWDEFRSSQTNTQEVFLQESPEADEWEKAEGLYSQTYKAKKIRSFVTELLQNDKLHNANIIVTDQEISPPPDLRYVIWSDRVISTAPTDPEYWNYNDPDRIAIIKHRVRSACLSVIGAALGLSRCENERCFLYRNVDSVLYLDGMVELGSEHDLKGLTGIGYEVRTGRPDTIQTIIENPQPDVEGRYVG